MYYDQENHAFHRDASHALAPYEPPNAVHPHFQKQHSLLLKGAALALCFCLLGVGAGAGAAWSLEGPGLCAGLRAGDIITQVDGADIRSMTDLSAAKKSYSAGDTAQFTVIRGGQTMQIPVTWGDEPDPSTSAPQDSQGQAGRVYGGYGSLLPLMPYYGG